MATKTLREVQFGGVPGDSFASGALRFALYDVTFSASYTTGGEVVDLSREFATVLGVFVQDAGGYKVEYAAGTGPANGKLKVLRYDYAATAAGPAVEVPAATDLSTLTVTILVVGYDQFRVG